MNVEIATLTQGTQVYRLDPGQELTIRDASEKAFAYVTFPRAGCVRIELITDDLQVPDTLPEEVTDGPSSS